MSLRTCLSVMMFLQYFAWGAWYVTFGTYMSHVTAADGSRIFSDGFVGDAFGTAAIGAMIAPIFVGMLADRFFATERLMAVLHFAGAALLFYLTTIREPALFYVVALAYFLTLIPAVALSNSLALHHLPDRTREYPLVRVWGTIAWVIAGVLVGTLGIEATSTPMVIGAVVQLAVALFCFVLPHTPPAPKHESSADGVALGPNVVTLFKDRSFTIFMIGLFLISIPMQFYYTFSNPFLNELGVANAAGKQTIGQLTEIVCMLLMPALFPRLGVKWMLALAMAAWALRYFLFALGNAGDRMAMIYGGIVVHGICYVFFFVTGQIYIDNKVSRRSRAAAQGLLTVVTMGLGQFLGAIISGRVVAHLSAAAGHDWRDIWMIPSAMSAASLAFFVVCFQDRSSDRFDPAETIVSSAEEPVIQLSHETFD
jgi:nucleoside transporter